MEIWLRPAANRSATRFEQVRAVSTSRRVADLLARASSLLASQGRSHRGGHGGCVPRAPYHVPLHQNDNRQFIFGNDFWQV